MEATQNDYSDQKMLMHSPGSQQLDLDGPLNLDDDELPFEAFTEQLFSSSDTLWQDCPTELPSVEMLCHHDSTASGLSSEIDCDPMDEEEEMLQLDLF